MNLFLPLVLCLVASISGLQVEGPVTYQLDGMYIFSQSHRFHFQAFYPFFQLAQMAQMVHVWLVVDLVEAMKDVTVSLN